MQLLRSRRYGVTDPATFLVETLLISTIIIERNHQLRSTIRCTPSTPHRTGETPLASVHLGSWVNYSLYSFPVLNTVGLQLVIGLDLCSAIKSKFDGIARDLELS